MVALSEQFTADMFKRVDQEEIRRVDMAMSNMDQINPEVVEELLKEFLDKLKSELGPMIGGDATARKALQMALGDEGARALMAELDRAKEPVPFERVKMVNSKTLAGFIRSEHPQIIAVILAHLPKSKAAEVVCLFPENL